MIIGNGDIGSVLPEAMRPADDGYIFFASGVSNSQETRQEEYDREVDLLMEQDKRKHLVYFSSLAIFYSNTRYVLHKHNMEDLVRKNFDSYTIVRLGNITWGNNLHTLINFIRNKLKNGEPYEIKDEYRYVINKEEFLHWIDLIPEFNCEMNCPGRRMKVAEIVAEFCR